MPYEVVKPSATDSAQFPVEIKGPLRTSLVTVNTHLKRRGDWYRQRYGKPFIPHQESPVEPDAELAEIESALSKSMPGILVPTTFEGLTYPSVRDGVRHDLEEVNLIVNELRMNVTEKRRAELREKMRQLPIFPALIVSSPNGNLGTKIFTGLGELDHTAIYEHLEQEAQRGLIVSGYIAGIQPMGSGSSIFCFVAQNEDVSTGVWVTDEVLTAEEVVAMDNTSRRTRANVTDFDVADYRWLTRNYSNGSVVSRNQVTLPVYILDATDKERVRRVPGRAILLSHELKEVDIHRFTAHKTYAANRKSRPRLR